MLSTPTESADTADRNAACSRHGPKIGAGRNARCGLCKMQLGEMAGNRCDGALSGPSIGDDFLGGDPLDHAFLDTSFSDSDKLGCGFICKGQMFVDRSLRSNAGRYDIFDSFESHIIGSFDWLVVSV